MADETRVSAPPRTAAGSVARAVAIFGSFRYGHYFESILAGVVAGAERAGGTVISIQGSDGVLPSSYELGAQAGVSRAAWDHFDSAIVILQVVSVEYVARLRAAGKFVVAIGQDVRGTHTAISLDNAGGVRDAVAHLAGHGHTAIGFLSPSWQVDSAERYTAYREQLTELGLTPLPMLGADLRPDVSMDEEGYIAAQEFLAAGRPCTAVLAGTDLFALGFMRGLRDSGVSVPDDVAVVGIDDIAEAAVSTPPLATVAISFERVGEMAFDVALRGGSGQQMESRYVVSQRLVPRESCGCSSGFPTWRNGGNHSPVAVFAAELTRAAHEASASAPVNQSEVTDVTNRLVASLSGSRSPNADIDRRERADLAAAINRLCPLDRSVQSVLKAVRLLAQSLAAEAGEQDPQQIWSVSHAALDLCDAVRSGQLQRRMAEYVDLKRMQVSHYFIGNSLLGHDRDQLRSLVWLQQTPARAGALGLWTPTGQSDQVAVHGVYERWTNGSAAPADPATGPVEAFPPPSMLRDPTGAGRLVVITQVRFEDSDWGLLAVAGGGGLQSSLVQETFHQWSIAMSVSLDQERADADLARQAVELQTAYETEMALLEEVRISEERYGLVAEAAQDALWDWDIGSGKVFYSSRWKALLGYHEQEIGPSPDEWLSRVHPDDVAALQERLYELLDGREQFLDVEHRIRASTGEHRWMACIGRSVTDEEGRPVRLVGSVTDVTVRRLLQEQLVQEAQLDSLTGLAKSTLFRDRLSRAIELANRRPDYRFAVLFIDLNDFKAVNDTLGHATGDALLASVAGRLADSLRRNDTAARLGGDEFAILLSDVNDAELPIVVERLEAAIRAPHQIGADQVTVGVAIGVSFSGSGHASADTMLHDADTAMYLAKRRAKSTAMARVSGDRAG